MRKSLVEELEPVTVPDGVRIRGFEPSDEKALLEVNATAFAHHPEQGHMTHEDFTERTSESWFDPAGPAARRPGRPEDAGQPPLLGFHWTKVHSDEDPPYGEVYVVAVNPKAAGRGLGTVLTRAGLAHLRDQGLDSVLLYVDGDNAPAIAVYSGQGFHVERTEAQYRGTSQRTRPEGPDREFRVVRDVSVARCPICERKRHGLSGPVERRSPWACGLGNRDRAIVGTLLWMPRRDHCRPTRRSTRTGRV